MPKQALHSQIRRGGVGWNWQVMYYSERLAHGTCQHRDTARKAACEAKMAWARSNPGYSRIPRSGRQRQGLCFRRDPT